MRQTTGEAACGCAGIAGADDGHEGTLKEIEGSFDREKRRRVGQFRQGARIQPLPSDR